MAGTGLPLQRRPDQADGERGGDEHVHGDRADPAEHDGQQAVNVAAEAEEGGPQGEGDEDAPHPDAPCAAAGRTPRRARPSPQPPRRPGRVPRPGTAAGP